MQNCVQKDVKKLLYSNRLLKASALLGDMRLFVKAIDEHSIQPSKMNSDVAKILGKKTISRAQDVYSSCLVPRLISGDPAEAWHFIKPLEGRNVPIQIVRPIYYWVTARSERIIYDFVQDELWQKMNSVNRSITVADAAIWLRNKLKESELTWSKAVVERMAQGILATLRDFGILQGAVKKRISSPYLPLESFAYLAFLLFTLGNSGSKLANHPDWRIFLLTHDAVEELFFAAHQRKFLIYEVAGNLIRISFFAKNVEEMANAIA